MKPRHLILMVLKATGNRLESKTKLQKLVYFYSLLLNRDLGYKPHFYGPYSPLVEKGLDELTGAGFVNMRVSSYGIDFESGFERKKFEYELSEPGIRLADRLSDEYKNEYECISALVSNLKRLGNPDYTVLSFAAKAYFIIKAEGKEISIQSITSKMEEFDWKVPTNGISEAVNILENLGFVKKV